MKTPLPLLAGIVLMAAAVPAARAESITCPPTIQVLQTLTSPLPAGWSGGDRSSGDPKKQPVTEGLKIVSTRRAGVVKIYQGDPADDRVIGPVEVTATRFPLWNQPDKIIRQLWRFDESDGPLWLACTYQSSKVEFTHPLPQDVQTCRASYNASSEPESIECE